MDKKDTDKYDIVALGELLVDMLPYGISPRGNDLLEVNPGGAPCNMLSMAASLGSRCAFIGKVGADAFGRFLSDAIQKRGIATEGVVFDSRYTTTIAFVHLDRDTGERDFTFCRKPGADIMLSWEETNNRLIDCAKVFHFGSVSLSASPSRETTRAAVSYARAQGKTVSFDPNIRWPLWDDPTEVLEQVRFGLANCDILKISADELRTLYGGESSIDATAGMLLRDYPGIRVAFITMGCRGCYYRLGDYANQFPAFTEEKAIDTTGAGDCFTGVCLHKIAQVGLEGITPEILDEMVQYASAAATIIVTRYGSLNAMPNAEETEALLTKYGVTQAIK